MTHEKAQDSDQGKILVTYWIEKAHESLESARSEYQNGRMSFAMNRIYYCAFYALTALFKDQGKVFKKHKGLRSALHRDLVRNGLIDMQWGKFFDDVFESRQRGDYTPMITFDEEQVENFLQQAESFLEEIKALLKI